MQKLRLVHGVGVREVARRFGCSPSHVSRVERGATKPSRALVQFYDSEFGADGMLASLFEVAAHTNEQKRRRSRGRPTPQRRAIQGDSARFVDETIPNGTVMQAGEFFVKTWKIQNNGAVPWKERRLERQGPLTGPGLITSPAYADVPETHPGDIAEISIVLKAPGYDSTSIAYFKMVDSDGLLSFPDDYALGLEVIVRVSGQLPTQPFGPTRRV